MRTLLITSSCLALALIVTFVGPRGAGEGGLPASGTVISILDLTLAAGALARPEYADAH